MASIDELRDIVFYIIRKVNDVIINFTTPPQPQPPRLRFRARTEEERQRFNEQTELIDRMMADLRRSINGEDSVREECERIDVGVSELLRRVNEEPIPPPPPPPPPPSPSPQEMIGEFIKQDEERIIDLQKQAHEKRIILNYLLDELIQRRERKEDAIVIKLLEEEFERLRLERERLEKRIIELKEHIRFMQS